MEIGLKHMVLLIAIVLQGCQKTKTGTMCLQNVQSRVGDTLVVKNEMDGIQIEDFNFIIATEKYLQGITEDSINYKIRIEICTQLDSTKRKVDAVVLKSNKSNTNFIDYISWMQDENPIRSRDRSIPYIIHPVTGELNRIKDGVVIRNIVDESFVKNIIQSTAKIEEWNEYRWEEKSIVNFSVELLEGEYKVYYGNCRDNIPKTILTVLNNFGIEY